MEKQLIEAFKEVLKTPKKTIPAIPLILIWFSFLIRKILSINLSGSTANQTPPRSNIIPPNRIKMIFFLLIGIWISLISQMCYNVFEYGKLRFCVRGFSEGKSEASKQSNSQNCWYKSSDFLYTLLGHV